MDLDLDLLSTLFDSLPVGLIALDQRGQVVLFNRAEEQLAARSRANVLGRDFFSEIAPCMNVKALGGEFSSKIGKTGFDVNIDFSFAFPFLDRPRDVRVRMMSFDAREEPHALLMVEDLTTQRSVERMRETLQGLLVHDLKNPLSAIVGNLQYLESLPDVIAAEGASESIADGIDGAGRMQAMLLNLLDITRLETASMPVRRTEIDLRDLVHRALHDSRAMARVSGATVSVDAPLPVPTVGDESLLRRSIDNLVENALRYGKTVILRARREADSVLLEVIDDGPGVPVAQRERIFEKYGQVEQAHAGQASANRGLGLTFVRLAALAQGGDVSVHDAEPRGSCFRIRLPAPG